MAARGEAQADVEVSTLVVPAWRLRWRAPELALVLGERAVALASTRRDEIDRLRAESLVIFAANRMGRGVRIADRALDALRASEKAGEQETSWRLRIELAACATAVGAPLTGFGAVRPVLAADGVPHALRAAALVQASDCLVTIGRGPQPGMALSEADQLYVADTLLDADTRLLQRGLLHASAAAQHRRWGDLQAATDAAGRGLELLAKLGDPSVDSGQVRAKLTLELVCALMDSNRLAEASEVGSPLLDLPVRAPSAGDVGWLRLALATRVHLPAGRVDLARGMLRDAADSAQRHQLDTLLAESLLALAHVHEVSGDLAEALTDLRSAHAAERRRARAVYAVRARLAAEFSGAHRQPVSPHEQLGSLLRPGEGRSPSAQGVMRGSQPPADAVLAPELKQQLRQWRPTQATPKPEGPRVKRALRAAEDMTVEGISAARAHAADRWRLVQPFGTTAPEPAQDPADAVASTGGRRRAEDRDPAATDLPATSERGGETAVPATGLIAAAGAMRSGRRRAAREAAEEDTTPTQAPSAEPSVPTAPWAAGQAAPDETPDPAPAAADGPDHGTEAQGPEVANVLDTLEAAGLLNKRRSGGRRRAPDSESPQPPAADPAPAASAPEPEPPSEPAQPPVEDTPKWRVEPPKRLRSDDDQPKRPPSDLFDAPTTVYPAVGADGMPVERPAAGLGAAFAKGPVIPTARTPQSSGLEPPHRSTPDATPPGEHPTAAPRVGPDFRLGADSLGRSGFRPASDQPPVAPGAFPVQPENAVPAEPQGSAPVPQGQGSTGPDFRLPADSFGRDGFRTANAADPDPTTPQNWPPTTTSGHGAPDLPTTSPPDHGSTSRQPGWAGSESGAQTPDWSADAAVNRAAGLPPDFGLGQGSGRTWVPDDGPGFGAGSAADWTADALPGTGSRPADRPSDDPGPAEAPPTGLPNDEPGSDTHHTSGAGEASAQSGRRRQPEPDAGAATPGSDFARPDPRHQTDHGFTTGSRQPAGAGFDTPDHTTLAPGTPQEPTFGADRPTSAAGFGPGADRGAPADGFGSHSDGPISADGFGADRSGLGDGFGSRSDRPASADGFGFDRSGPGDGFGSHSDRPISADGFGADRSGPGDGFGSHSDRPTPADGFGSGADRPAPADAVDSRSDRPAPSDGLGSPSDPPSWASGARPNWDPGYSSSGAADPGIFPGAEFGAAASGKGAPPSDFSFDVDFPRSSEPDALTAPRPPGSPTPDREPEQVPAVPEPGQVPEVPEPDQVPPIPDPDPIPQPAPIPMPPTSSGFDLGRSRFLTSADVEDDLPELPRRVPAEAPPVEPDPFVTAVVVGDRTIEVPSAARASRRHKSDLSLAELLTEALVAYETGRRSDPDPDQTAGEEIADWISSAETPTPPGTPEPPASPISPDRLERAGHHVAEPEPAADPEPRPRAVPTDSEKTTYLTPVRDVESTAPIWEPGPDGEPHPPYDSWTLPES
ncbi:hypothetical protein [Umezawaea sp.]|uniref:hypothetical protein n=1 Tax=Umezawaea sp. TaxID=1955258 RepID=UPI002ED673B3